jgi:hypothetical protein
MMRSSLVAVYKPMPLVADPRGLWERVRGAVGREPPGAAYAAFERSVATPPARLQAVTPRRASSRASV